MSQDDFKLMCCISGNDYLKNDKNIFHYFSLHKKFKKEKLTVYGLTGYLIWKKLQT